MRNVYWSRVSGCLSVPRRIPTLLYGPGVPDVTWGNGKGCRLVVCYWADLQSVHGFRCCDDMHSAERETSASACTRSIMRGYVVVVVVIVAVMWRSRLRSHS